jgi:hypothetical protein
MGMRFEKPSSNTWVEVLIIFLVLTVIFGCTLGPLLSAKMESDTYNKLTGAKTTWWDALWVELRVQDAPKKEESK